MSCGPKDLTRLWGPGPPTSRVSMGRILRRAAFAGHMRWVWRRGDRRLAARGHPARLGRTTQGDTMADGITKRIARLIEAVQVTPGAHVELAKDLAPRFKAGGGKEKGGG